MCFMSSQSLSTSDLAVEQTYHCLAPSCFLLQFPQLMNKSFQKSFLPRLCGPS